MINLTVICWRRCEQYVRPNPADPIRWGQTGLGFQATTLYIVQGAIVKDTNGSPADLKVTAQTASMATTGDAPNYQFQATNAGPK